MRYVFLVLLALVLASSGCASRDRCSVYHLIPGTSEEYRPSLQAAAERWTHFSGESLTIAAEDSDEAACSLSVVQSPEEYERLKEEANSEFLASHRDEDGSIHLAPWMYTWREEYQEAPTPYVTSLLMHELGHEWGMSHVADPAAVMGITNPIPRTDYNASDAAELARVRR